MVSSRYRRNKRNRYLQDRAQMTQNFSGMGDDFGARDAWGTDP
jgi:hypothetical protein